MVKCDNHVKYVAQCCAGTWYCDVEEEEDTVADVDGSNGDDGYSKEDDSGDDGDGEDDEGNNGVMVM